MPSEQPTSSKQHLLFWATILFALGLTILCVWLIFNPELMRHFEQWGYFGAFIVNAFGSATVILPMPTGALILAMSTVLNPWWLSIVSGVGSACGELTGYFAGAAGKSFIPDSQKETVERIHNLTEKYGAFALFLLSAYPFPLFDIAGIVAGATGMKLWQFWVATALGKIVKYSIFIFVGSAPLGWLQHWWRS